MKNERLDWPDIIKGIAIILVVYGHVTRGLQNSGKLSFDGIFGYVDYTIYTIHMPIFFAVSGFLYERGHKNRKSFWKDKIVNIAWPYLIWTTVQVSLQTFLGASGAVNNPASLTSLLYIIWQPFSTFWFLHTLFIVFVLSHAIFRIQLHIILIIAFFLIFTAHFIYPIQITSDVSYGFFYFTVGRAILHKENTEFKIKYILIIANILAFIATTLIFYHLNIDVRLDFIGTIIGLAATFNLSKFLTGTALKRPLIILGRCSMGIFVMHLIFVGIFRFVGIKILHLGPMILILGCTIIGIIIPTLVQIIANATDTAKFLGLKTKIDDIIKKPTSTLQTPQKPVKKTS